MACWQGSRWGLDHCIEQSVLIISLTVAYRNPSAQSISLTKFGRFQVSSFLDTAVPVYDRLRSIFEFVHLRFSLVLNLIIKINWTFQVKFFRFFFIVYEIVNGWCNHDIEWFKNKNKINLIGLYKDLYTNKNNEQIVT